MRHAVVLFVILSVGLVPTVADENPKDASAYINRGLAWMDKKEYDKAIADYNEAIRLKPKDAFAYINRGNAWGQKKEYGKAITDYDEAIRLNPKDAWAYINRGNAWSNKKEYGKAIADYNQAIRLERFFLAYRNRAWLEATCPDARFRDGKKAVDDATKACDLAMEAWGTDGWKNAICLEALAAAYAEAGDFHAAVKWQTTAIELVDAKTKAHLQSRLKLYRDHKPYRQEPNK
jgi:tetratricopeptide (TPR) repeat protein